jgi:RNA polymerase sigma-70 factor (ECF subfamily)
MRTFEYDPSRSFRAYVKTLTQFTLRDLLEARRRAGPSGSGDTSVLEQLENVAARDDLDARLAEAFHQELISEASALVQLRVEPRTWEAFRLTALEGCTGAEATARTGMEVATVFKAKSKVRRMLREEVSRLTGALPR